MGSWVRGKCIGKGAFGTVSVAFRKRDSQIFAVKSVDVKTGHPIQLEALENEIRILQRMSSPHVVTFLGEDVTCEQRNLHLEYLPRGTLADLDADVEEALVRRYTWCLVNALRHVHANGVVHCDVKGKNVLVGDNCCKLADFGSAAEFSGEGFHTAAPRGSPLWMAPEVIRLERQGPAADVWSLGCTVIEMLTGKPPWEGNSNAVDALSRIGYADELPEFPTRLSELGRDFLEKCLRREPSRRWSCDQLLQHPFLLPCSVVKIVESSPRCVLDRVNSVFAEFDDDDDDEERIETENSVRGRIGKLAMSVGINWETEDWVVVRELVSDAEVTVAVDSCEDVKEGTCPGNYEIVGVEWGLQLGVNMNCLSLENERVKLEKGSLGKSEWKNSRKSEASWGCECGWENVDKKKRILIKINVYMLHCKLLKFIVGVFKFKYRFMFWDISIYHFSWNCDKNMLIIIVERMQPNIVRSHWVDLCAACTPHVLVEIGHGGYGTMNCWRL